MEVKNWETQVSSDRIEAFIALKQAHQQNTSKTTGYLFYSERGLGDAHRSRLAEAEIMYADSDILTAYQQYL